MQISQSYIKMLTLPPLNLMTYNYMGKHSFGQTLKEIM